MPPKRKGHNLLDCPFESLYRLVWLLFMGFLRQKNMMAFIFVCFPGRR